MSESEPSVLIIDDDEIDRERASRLLGRSYHLLQAEQGAEGLDLYLQQRPACVLLDYMLPDIEGLELLEDLIRRGATVIMLTGQGNEQVAVEAMKHGAQDYLVKDHMDSDLLRRAIRNAIEKASLQDKIRRQQEQLKHHAEELQRSNEKLQQFAYVASHDLQEPLRSVSSFCNLLQEQYQGQLDERADRWMSKIVRGSERMKTMVQDLLVYSRVESRGRDFERIDCEQIFANVKIDLATAIRKSAATVTCGRLPTVMADQSQFTQLLQNLIGNAIKYRGDEPPRVHVQAERDDGMWVFSVKDNGIGIDPEYFSKVFQMFKRLHTRDEYPGTGIGLSLCQRIVHRHGGKIWVESEAGSGSTFYFTIPDTKATEDEREPIAVCAS